MSDDLRRAFQKAVKKAEYAEYEHGWLGKRNSDGTYTIKVPGHKFQVYVRITRGDQATVTTAINHAVANTKDLPVLLTINASGEREIVGVDPGPGEKFAEGNSGFDVPIHSHRLGRGMPDMVEGLRFEPGVVHRDPVNKGLYVEMEPFFYLWNGALGYWPGGSLNLASYAPTVEDKHGWVLVGHNPSTNTMTAVKGDDYALTLPLKDLPSYITDIDFGTDNPKGAVLLHYGQTAIDDFRIFCDTRLWANGAGLLVGPGETGWNVDSAPDDPSAYDDEFADASFDAVLWTEYDSDTIETIAEASGYLSLSQATQATATLTGVYQADPTGDLTLVAKIRLDHNTGGAGYHFAGGLVLWEDATDDTKDALIIGPMLITNTYRGFGSTFFAEHDDLDTAYTPHASFDAATWYYIRLRRSGTTYYFDWSDDGETWGSKDITTHVTFTPGHFGVGLYNQDTGDTLQADIEFFRYRDVFDSQSDPVYGRNTLYVRVIGDTMTGPLEINVATADDNAIILKSTDDNATKNLFQTLSSADAVTASVSPAGAIFGSTGHFGDAATNYAALAADGEITLAGTARVKRQVVFSGAVLALGSVPPTEAVLGNYPAYEYTIGDDSVMTCPVPNDWASGTDIDVSVRWGIDEAYATASAEVQWRAEWSLTPADASEALDGATHTGSDASGDVNIPATAKTLLETTVETIAAANIAAGDQLGLKVSRVAIDDGTDPTAEPFIVSVIGGYVANKLGEAT